MKRTDYGNKPSRYRWRTHHPMHRELQRRAEMSCDEWVFWGDMSVISERLYREHYYGFIKSFLSSIK